MNDVPFSKIISLISEIHYDASNFLRAKLAAQGLRDIVSSHGNILYQLSIHRKLNMKELSAKINKNKSTATVLVKKLEAAGYVEKVQSLGDNRVWYITLSALGETFIQPTASISHDLLETCYSDFSDDEKRLINELLQKMAHNFKNSAFAYSNS